jgi:hypothetical protein
MCEATPVSETGHNAKIIVVERPTQKPGETHGSEAENTYEGVQSAGGTIIGVRTLIELSAAHGVIRR